MHIFIYGILPLLWDSNYCLQTDEAKSTVTATSWTVLTICLPSLQGPRFALFFFFLAKLSLTILTNFAKNDARWKGGLWGWDKRSVSINKNPETGFPWVGVMCFYPSKNIQVPPNLSLGFSSPERKGESCERDNLGDWVPCTASVNSYHLCPATDQMLPPAPTIIPLLTISPIPIVSVSSHGHFLGAKCPSSSHLPSSHSKSFWFKV